MSDFLFEAEIYIPLYQHYPPYHHCANYLYQQLEVRNIPYPLSLIPYYHLLLQKVFLKPLGVVFPFESGIICIPSKINFGLLYTKKVKKVIIWNAYRSKAIKINQIKTTDSNVFINLSENEKINANYCVETEVVAYPTGKTLMINDFFQILWDVT